MYLKKPLKVYKELKNQDPDEQNSMLPADKYRYP